MMTNLPLETAKHWVSQGHAVIPIQFGRKVPALKTWEAYQTTLPTESELHQWFNGRLSNLALVIGGGLLVIDFDVQAVFDYWYVQNPIQTYMVKTRRGVHVYVKTEEQAKNYHSVLLDVKAERGYVLVPPSLHPSGYRYQVLMDAPIIKVQSLSMVLPVEFMPEPERVETVPVDTNRPGGDDPWADAENAHASNGVKISAIKSALPILSLLPAAKRSSTDGRWYVALCPFHADHTPSFWIDNKRQVCGCRKCNIKEMDVINLFARLNGITNDQALMTLAERVRG